MYIEISRNKSSFTCINKNYNICIIAFIDVATGSSMDWVKDKLNTNLTITYELRDKGQYGHLLPPEQIYPSALEFMDGLKVLISELSKGIPEVDP